MENTKLRMFTLNSTDNLAIHCESDFIDGKLLDTKVILPVGGTLCWVSGDDRDKFIEELNNLIAKYRI